MQFYCVQIREELSLVLDENRKEHLMEGNMRELFVSGSLTILTKYHFDGFQFQCD